MAQAGLKFITATELRIALKGLLSSWDGVGRQGLLLSISPSLAFMKPRRGWPGRVEVTLFYTVVWTEEKCLLL